MSRDEHVSTNSDDEKWTHETSDPRSALIEQLRGLKRVTRGKVAYVKAADLDDVLNAAIEEPKDAA